MDALRQAKSRSRTGSVWWRFIMDNVYDMVFTRDNGMFIRFKTLYVPFQGTGWQAQTVRRFASTIFATPTPPLLFKAKLTSKRFPCHLDMQPSPSRSTPTDTSATICRKTRQPRWRNSSARCKKRRIERIAVFRGYGKEERLWVRSWVYSSTKKPKPLHLQGFRLVEHSGFEPLTPTLPVLCATSCANAPQHKIV